MTEKFAALSSWSLLVILNRYSDELTLSNTYLKIAYLIRTWRIKICSGAKYILLVA